MGAKEEETGRFPNLFRLILV